MKESDWKKFKVLKTKCLERFCSDILEHSKSICEAQAGDAHARYCEMFQYIRDRDKEIAYTFDGLSRSQAEIQLLKMYQLNLYELSALDGFDSDIKDSVTRLSKI